MDIREIAKRARVSTATVSRVVNRVPTVNPQMAKRVWNVIEELGYYPNTQARALVSGRSRIFGLIISDITNPFFPEIVQVFEAIAVQHRYEILLSSTSHDPKRMSNRTYRYFEGTPLYPFGYGLSYSKFEYSNVKLSAKQLSAGAPLTVDADVKNTSQRDGDEVAEIYLHFPNSPGAPLRALRGFTRVHIGAGETEHVRMMLA